MFCLHFSVFRPILKKRCFWTSFGSLLVSILASFWLPGAPRGSPWHPKGRFRDLFLSTCFSCRFLVDFGCPPGPPKPTRRHARLDLWRCGKTPHSEEKWSKPYGKTLFWQSCVFLAQWKGGLLRGKVSQGQPHPLSTVLRGEGQTLNKKII